MKQATEIKTKNTETVNKYQITGTAHPTLTVTLEPEDSIIAQAGSMTWMTEDVKMEIIDDKSVASYISNRTRFNTFTAKVGIGVISLANNKTGQIAGLAISADNEIIVRPDAILAMDNGIKQTPSEFDHVELVKLSGEGNLFISSNGDTIEYQLTAGQTLQIDENHLLAYDSRLKLSLHVIAAKSAIFGGEGRHILNATGPGNLWLQTRMHSSNSYRNLWVLLTLGCAALLTIANIILLLITNS